MKTVLLFLFSLAFGFLAGAQGSEPRPLPWDVSDALASAPLLILYSLEPSPATGADEFHGRKILGQTTINDSETRKRIAKALIDSAARSDGLGARCFNPRHALRFGKGSVVYDLVICFECKKVEIYTSGISMRQAGISDGDKILNEVLSAARVPFSKHR